MQVFPTNLAASNYVAEELNPIPDEKLGALRLLIVESLNRLRYYIDDTIGEDEEIKTVLAEIQSLGWDVYVSDQQLIITHPNINVEKLCAMNPSNIAKNKMISRANKLVLEVKTVGI